jgi:hypothetical protein
MSAWANQCTFERICNCVEMLNLKPAIRTARISLNRSFFHPYPVNTNLSAGRLNDITSRVGGTFSRSVRPTCSCSSALGPQDVGNIRNKDACIFPGDAHSTGFTQDRRGLYNHASASLSAPFIVKRIVWLIHGLSTPPWIF